MYEFNNGIDFAIETGEPTIIKVIGVGGGGGNAVSHMYREGVHNVSFVICNTDNQALSSSPVPVKLQLGREGLGAGNRPARARQAAEESLEDIKKMLDDGTKMAFITAGMGGGTGTGAAPVIASAAKEMGILTIGIVTIPFRFEGNRKIDQALDGVDEMSKHVDALLVINNERLLDIYSDFTLRNAFAKADDTLSVASRSIAEIITTQGLVNIDFRDVEMALKDGGVAIISTGYAEGEKRVTHAIDEALHSPLLNNNNIYNSKKVLLSITFCAENENDELRIDEMTEVSDFMQKFSVDVETKWGYAIDPTLGKKVKITVLASGFGFEGTPGMEQYVHKHSQEELDRSAERAARRGKVYDGNSPYVQKSVYSHFIYNTPDLDNDDIISMVDTTPTYKRSKKVLDSIKEKSKSSDRDNFQSSEETVIDLTIN